MATPKSKLSSMRPETVRMAVLVTLVVQNSAQSIFMRYSFKPKEKVEGEEPPPAAASTTAVVLAELFKLICSLILQYRDDGGLAQLATTLREDVWEKPRELLKMAVPACLYVLQNNLNYVAVSNLDSPTYQLMYQLKILTTALFSVVMLKRVLILKQWGALAMLALGVGLVQIASKTGGDDDESKKDGQDPVLGLVAVLMSCCTSGFAGVYFEKVLKGTTVSLWVRNMQLSGFGVLLGAFFVWYRDGASVAENGFYYGYNYAVWMSVVLNSLGGLVVAMVVKYADNVIKGFATSVSIVLTALVAVVLFDFSISIMFVVGAYFVLHSTVLFSQKPPANGNGSSGAPSSSTTAATTGSGNGMANGELELPEAELLLVSESTVSPRGGRGKSATQTAPRKNSRGSSFVERDPGPV